MAREILALSPEQIVNLSSRGVALPPAWNQEASGSPHILGLLSLLGNNRHSQGAKRTRNLLVARGRAKEEGSL